MEFDRVLLSQFIYKFSVFSKLATVSSIFGFFWVDSAQDLVY